jgi:hypothetical protein
VIHILFKFELGFICRENYILNILIPLRNFDVLHREMLRVITIKSNSSHFNSSITDQSIINVRFMTALRLVIVRVIKGSPRVWAKSSQTAIEVQNNFSKSFLPMDSTWHCCIIKYKSTSFKGSCS